LHIAAQNLRCNEAIRLSPVRVIDQNGEQVGIIPTEDALRMARDASMDLVEIAPNERPPVCRIMDYGKFKYQQKKKKQKSHDQVLKEVRLRPKTDDNDRRIKLNNALRFLRKGDKVQFTMMFRGRERAHMEIAIEIFSGIADRLGDLVKVERRPSRDGRNMVMIVAPNKPAIEKAVQAGTLKFDALEQEDEEVEQAE
jgi:translation initiation factor IF-3